MMMMDRRFPWRTAAISLAIIAVASACGDLQRPYLLQDKQFRIAYIEDSRTEDNSLLIDELLTDAEPDIRAKAALAIGRVGGEFYRAGLKAHLDDSAAAVSEAKYFAAGLCGDSGFVDTLLALARSGRPARATAIEAAGRLADSGRAARFGAYLNDADSMVVYQALLALWRSKGWSQAGEMTRIGLATANRRILYGALYALARGGRPEGRPLFRKETTDADPEFRMLAYAGLGRTVDTAAFDALSAGLSDADERVVAGVITALEAFGPKGTAVLGRAIADIHDKKNLTLALEALGRKPFAGAATVVEGYLRSDTQENVAAAAAKALLAIRGAGALATVDRAMPEPTPWQKQNIAEGLAGAEGPAAEERLSVYFADSLPAVRAAALEAFCAVDSTACPERIRAGLVDTDFAVAATAVDLAARRNLTALIPDIARLAGGDPMTTADDLKRGIIGAWATFAADSEYDHRFDSLIVPALESACNDRWRVIRAEAADVLYTGFHIDRRGQVGLSGSKVEKNSFRRLFHRFPANPRAVIATARGTITVELLYDQAPLTVDNFIALAEKGFYDHRLFHRVVPNFVIQDGCPRGDGWGGPGYAIRCEYNREPYRTGTVGMALSGKDTGGSQYFITLSPQPHLDGRYTVFGRVVSGMEVARQTVRGDDVRTVTIQYPREER